MNSQRVSLISALNVLIFTSLILGEDPHSNKPAEVTGGVLENNLTLVTLTPQAVERLKIQTHAIEMKPVRITRLLGGEVQIPPGQVANLSAPVAGTLLAGDVAAVGQTVKKEQILFHLIPVLSSEQLGLIQAQASIIDAQGKMEQAQVQVDAARIKAERADRLKEENAGSVRAAQEAHAELDFAQTELKTAQSRLNTLTSSWDASTSNPIVTAIQLKSPLDGILQSLSISPGQMVASGCYIAQVVNLTTIWIRVSVYAGDWNNFNFEQGVSIQELGTGVNAILGVAKQIEGPKIANPAASTIDVFFELDNSQARLRPGQRVGVNIPTLTEDTKLVVPWSAVVFDIYGNAWVYEVVGSNQYSRTRVEIEYVLSDQAILSRGPKPNTQVVTVGVAELFGAEFSFGH